MDVNEIKKKFPDGFSWGAATAAYQVEGAACADGKGDSIWDWFTQQPGTVKRGEHGQVACEQYYRYPEDIRLMQELGLPVYRFSVSWPRILPEGTGTINAKGLDHYDRLVDALLAAGIDPCVTLYHWDLPMALHERGGWPNRDIASWFVDFATLVARRLGDRVRTWVTINEAWVCCYGGYLKGNMAPGIQDKQQAFHAAYHFNLAHGMAYSAMKELDSGFKIGLSHATQQHRCLDDDPASLQLAEFLWQEDNGVFLEPVLRGSYPEAVLNAYPDCFPEIVPEDLAVMNQYDFIGLQYYTDTLIEQGQRVSGQRPEYEYTEMDWPVTPEGLYQNIMECVRRYAPKEIIVTENGMALADEPADDGRVYDDRRQRYFEAHLNAVHRAIEDDAPLTGYYAWSFMDNFEWASGYRPRFGLVHVNYENQKRIIKESARWFSKVIRSNGW